MAPIINDVSNDINATDTSTVSSLPTPGTMTESALIEFMTLDYLEHSMSDDANAYQIAKDILDAVNMAFTMENTMLPKGRTLKYLSKLQPFQLAEILMHTHRIASVVCIDGSSTQRELDVLAVYQESGPDAGIYVEDDVALENLVRQYEPSVSKSQIQEVRSILVAKSDRVHRTRDRNLIAVNNGIFDFDTKELLPFSPDFVFLSKSRVNYNPNAQNVVIHNQDDNTDWDVESWMAELHDDPKVVNLLWEIIGAVLRPNVAWDKSAWFYAETGNNGKGTLCQLMCNILGDGTYASIPLTDFGKDFMLQPLLRAQAIIQDENDVDKPLDKVANLKAIITGDRIQMNRKFKTPITFQFHGFMVQCINDLPRVRDRTESFYRRQLFVPFEKCYTGVERRYIKQDYLYRTEVLEYVLYRVLHMDYYQLSNPKSSQELLAEYKMFNDAVRQFADEILPQLQWDFVPMSFLYDLYCAYFKCNFGGRAIKSSKQEFYRELLSILPDYPDWQYDGKSHKPMTKMDAAEPLIFEYNLEKWMDRRYLGSIDLDKLCHPALKATYQGLERV